MYNTQSSGEETHRENSSRLVVNEPIPNTPFRLVGGVNGFAIALGKYKLTEIKETKEEALEVLKNEQWNVIANMIITLAMEARLRELDEKESIADIEVKHDKGI